MSLWLISLSPNISLFTPFHQLIKIATGRPFTVIIYSSEFTADDKLLALDLCLYAPVTTVTLDAAEILVALDIVLLPLRLWIVTEKYVAGFQTFLSSCLLVVTANNVSCMSVTSSQSRVTSIYKVLLTTRFVTKCTTEG